MVNEISTKIDATAPLFAGASSRNSDRTVGRASF
jgi:hypothetical protein